MKTFIIAAIVLIGVSIFLLPAGCLRDCVVTGTVINVEYMESTAFLSHTSKTILTFSDGRVKVYSTIAKDVILNRPVRVYQSRVNNALTFELVEGSDG